jgi:aldehyde dehydrogenase (NAD(P)+)
MSAADSPVSAAVKLKQFANYTIETAVAGPPPSTETQMNLAIARLRQGANEFARLTIDQRIALAESMRQGYLRIADRSVHAGCRAKGVALGSPAEAEEWSTGPWGVVRQLRLIRESLQAIKQSGNTPIGPVTRTHDGRLSVRVFPGSAIDGVLFKNISVDVHMQRDINDDTLDSMRASFYKHPTEGGVVLVLGAGNIAAIGPMDVITKMFNEGKVCLLKMSPVNAYLGPFIEEAFAEAIKRNFLAVVYGGAAEGHYLVYHRDIDEVHITGSDKTHDQIVWGAPGPQQDERKRLNQPMLKKPITSELGNISPVIVVPGPYSETELRFQAEDAASYFVMNASFLCNAAKMMVLPAGWQGSDTYLQAVKDVCRAIPPRPAYYPGAEDRWRALTGGRAQVASLGSQAPGVLPWTFITGLDPSQDPLYSVEPFCSILSESRLGSDDPVEFLREAVDFVNNKLWGTLSATLVVHPKSLQDPTISKAVEQVIARLRYGTVAVNGFPGMSFVFGSPPWGAYPGSTLQDIQSGRGFVHNTSMLEGIEKVVMRYPLTSFPKPGYFLSHRTTHKLTPKLVRLEARPSWAKLPSIVLAAMRG